MPTVTLLEKIHGSFSLRTSEKVLSSLCKGLKIKIKVIGKTSRGWIKIEVGGEDEIAALGFLDREIGLAPVHLNKIRKFSIAKGRIISSRKSEKELYVDVGISSPEIYDAVLPLRSLRAQLSDGKKLPLGRLVELFCLYDNFPLKVKVVKDIDTTIFESNLIEAELPELQLSQVTSWIRSGLDRLIILGAFLSDVKHAVKKSKHLRDIIRIESIGILEHTILCKLGTDAIGLLSKIGHLLPDTLMAPFSPKKIRQLIGDSHYM